MRKARWKTIGKRVLQIGLPLLILGFFVYDARKWNWGALTTHTLQWNPWLLGLAFVGFLLQELSYGLIWQTVLARLGYRLDFRPCLRIYLASEFVRYIPGNVWHVLTRILWVNKYGVPRTVAFASMSIELITKLSAAALLFAASLLFWHDAGTVGSLLSGSWLFGLGIAGIVALLVVLHPRILNGLLNTALRLLKRQPIVLTVRYRDILIVTLAWCASWCVAGSAFFVLILAMWPHLPLFALPICIGIYALGWDIGFVTFITPSGLGFREGAIAGLLVFSLPFMPVSVAAVIAVLSRVVSTVAEILCVGAAYISGGKQVRAVQREQLTKEAPPPQQQGMAKLDEGTTNEPSSNALVE